MTTEEFEFLLMQYADGTLKGPQRDFVETRLLEDPNALVQLASYRRLYENLERATVNQPIRWDALAARISRATAQAEADRIRKRQILMRVAVVSVATCLLVIAGIFLHPRHPVVSTPLSNASSTPVRHTAEVTGPSIEASTLPGKAIVKIGPAPLTADAAERYSFSQKFVSEPSSVSIGSPDAGDRQ